MSTNQFKALFEDNTNKNNMNKNGIVRNRNGEINFLATIPDFAVLYEAMERGESWFDVMYPRGHINVNDVCKIESNPTESGKKRKYPFNNDGDNATKRMRHE
jgi:hypothetical protein